MSTMQIEIDGRVIVEATADQLAAWTKAAGEMPLTAWVAGAADVAAEAAVEELQLPRTIKLQHHVKDGDQTITSITMRRGRVGDIRGIKLRKELPTEDIILLASRLSGQPLHVINALDVDDAGEVMDIALVFFAKCLSTEKRLSQR